MLRVRAGTCLVVHSPRMPRSVRTSHTRKSPFVRTGLQKKTKQARLPVPVAYNLAEEGGFEPP